MWEEEESVPSSIPEKKEFAAAVSKVERTSYHSDCKNKSSLLH